MLTTDRPLRLQAHEIGEARRLLADLRNLANPRPSFLYDRYLAPAIDDLDREVHAYEAEQPPERGFRTTLAPILEDDGFTRCESGWTNDRCYLRLGHDGPHSND